MVAVDVAAERRAPEAGRGFDVVGVAVDQQPAEAGTMHGTLRDSADALVGNSQSRRRAAA